MMSTLSQAEITRQSQKVTDFLAAFLLGLVSAGHCLGMCGGLMIAAGLNARSPLVAFSYNAGRILTYVFLGATFGFLADFLPTNILPFLKITSAILLILTAFYLLGISHIIQKIEYIGKPIWSISQPIAKNFLPIRSPLTALALGFFWGFIPCGLVYTALAFSLSQANASTSALTMFFFGLGTFPAMISAALMAQKIRPLLSNIRVKKFMAILMFGFAILIVWQEFN